MVGDIAVKLSEELEVLYAKLASHPHFAPPRSASHVLRYIPSLGGAVTGGRETRAVSLPPSLPDHGIVSTNGGTESGTAGDQRPVRPLGEGIPQYQPYWYTPHTQVNINKQFAVRDRSACP